MKLGKFVIVILRRIFSKKIGLLGIFLLFVVITNVYYSPPMSAQIKLISPFGMNTGLAKRYPEQEEQTAKMLAEAGVGWSREEFSWEFIERNKIERVRDRDYIYQWVYRGQGYDYDRALKAALDHKVQVLGLLTYGPGWSNNQTGFDEILTYWRDFVRQIVTRYKGRIRYWEIENEQNITVFWPKVDKQATGANAADYVRLLRVAYEVIHEVDPEAQVVLGGMATGYNGTPGNVDYYAYLTQIYETGGWPYFDIVAIHPYRAPYSPETVIPCEKFLCSSYDVKNHRFQNSPNANRLIDELKAFETLMVPWGAKPIWVTEIGWSTESLKVRAKERSLERVAKGDVGKTTEETVQADYLIRAYISAIALPSVQMMMWYDFRDDNVAEDPNQPFAHLTENSYGIIRRDFSPKSAYYAYATMAKLLTGSSFERQVQGMNDYGRPGDDDAHEYRFRRGDETIAVLWKSQGGDEGRSIQMANITADKVMVYGPNFSSIELVGVEQTVTDGTLTLILTERPIFVVWQGGSLWDSIRETIEGWLAGWQEGFEEWWEQQQQEISRAVELWLQEQEAKLTAWLEEELERQIQQCCGGPAIILLLIVGVIYYRGQKGFRH